MGLTFLLRKVWRHSLWSFIPGSLSVLSIEDKVSHFDEPRSQGVSELGFDSSSKTVKYQAPGRGCVRQKNPIEPSPGLPSTSSNLVATAQG